VSSVHALTMRGVGFRSLAEPVLCTGPEYASDLADVIDALDGLRARLVSLQTRAGMVAAAASGRRAGRPTVMTPERVAIAVELRGVGRSTTHIARVLGVSANAVQRALAPIPPEP
jgi:DNA invertase Pin-like site-specific DNA recombinase